MIVVAINNTQRTRDLTPTHSTKMDGKDHDFLKNTGGGTAFLNFIKSELIPRIESQYRTMPYRIFTGHSFGGITVLNALYTMPQMFNAYIAIDPSVWWDDKLLLKKAKDHFLTTDLKERALFVSQANTLSEQDTINDHFEAIREFATFLESRNRSGMRWAYKYYPDDTHGSVPLVSEYDGLRFIFKDYPSSLGGTTSADDVKKMYNGFSEKAYVKFIPNEKVLNDLGGYYVYKEKYDEAQRCFELNIDYYPLSKNSYESMGKLCSKMGMTKKAIEWHEKILKLDPQNTKAKEAISHLKKGSRK
jgi:predicted alpha/beta superfamily hydrolase